MRPLSLVALMFFLLALAVRAPPPEPFGISGFVFDAAGTIQVPVDTAVSVNDTNTSSFVNTTTGNAPQSGYYSVVINGSVNDTVRVRAWNATHYGLTMVRLLGDMSNVNVSLNLTLPGEPNVTIVRPVEGQIFLLGNGTVIQANVSVAGPRDAVNCSATVAFTSPGLFALGTNATQFLGNLTLGTGTLVNWSALANATGITDVTVQVNCSDLYGGVVSDADTASNVRVRSALPPSPHGTAGWIFARDGATQMPLGTFYSINDSDTGFYMENVTRIPFPGFTGRYSETLNGTDGDLVTVRAWNSTHYGRTTVLLLGDMDGVNVSLNLTFPGEPNVTLLSPMDGAVFLSGSNVTIQANVTAVGAQDAVDCNATVVLTSSGVLSLLGSASQSLGNLTLGSSTLVNWSALANATGITDVRVWVNCSDPSSEPTSDADTASNVRVRSSLPPSPHGIAGWIFRQDNITQVPLGTDYSINDTDTGFYFVNVTRIPFPGFSGRYSETVDGSDGDLIAVRAWNSTHYGRSDVLLLGDMDNVNVTINLTRGSEANVTIVFPPDNVAMGRNRVRNVTARVMALGNDGENCSATVSFFNETVLNLTAGEPETKELGNISWLSFTFVSWNVTAEVGVTNVTVNATCLSDADNLEHLAADTILANITFPALAVSSVVVSNPVNLLAGSVQLVWCNATIMDENYAGNITLVNATLFQNPGSAPTAADDNNVHYTNASCRNVSNGEFEANYSCGFAVWYYANNGSWECNVTASDAVSGNENSTSNTTMVNTLFAIGADPVLDFGSLAPGATSPLDVNLTLHNYGNVAFNLSLEGNAVSDNDGLAMNCSRGNISIDLERYFSLAGLPYGQMVNLTGDPVLVDNFTLYQRTNDTAQDEDRNLTYWKLQVPYGTRGACNGTVTALATV